MSKNDRVVASTRLIAALTLLSRILGLARESAYGYFFGTGPLLSSFRIAFMIPNLARRLFGEGALSAAFIPVFTRTIRSGDMPQARRLAGAVLTLLVTILAGIVVVGESILIVANGMSHETTLELTTIMFPFLGLICVAAFLGGILNVLGRFALPAASPIVLNVFVILAMVGGHLNGFSGLPLIKLVCGSVLLAGGVQVAMHVVAVRAVGFRPALNRDWSTPGVREIVAFMGPMIVGLSTVQINTMVDKLIAWFFVPDHQGPAVLGFAQFLYQLPLGVFGIALATAIFPTLARHAADDDHERFTRTVERGIRMTLFVAIPATAGLILVVRPLVQTLFQHGRFSAAGTDRVAAAVIFYAIGLAAYFIQHIIVRAFYSKNDAATPARISAAVVAVNVVLNLVLVGPMREAGVALATAIAAWVQLFWSAARLSPHLASVRFAPIVSTIVKTLLGTAAMAVAVAPIVMPSWSLLPVDTQPWLRVLIAVPVGVLVMGLAAHLLRITELAELLRRGDPDATSS